MTTVLCDGKYLLTDHRLTTRAGSERRIAITKGREDSLAFLSDCFASTPVNQAHALATILNETKSIFE